MPIRDHNPSGKLPLVTILIALINSAVFLFELSLTKPQLEAFIENYALIPTLIDPSNPITLKPFVTSMFLHGSPIHIVSNMLFLWVFGDNIEAVLGKFKYIVFYFTGGILATIGQFIFIQNSETPMLGASGAIAAVLGAYFVLYPQARIEVLVPIFFIPAIIVVPASFMLAYWFVTQLLSGIYSLTTPAYSLGGIAFIAHAAGFVSGALLIRIFLFKKHIAN